MESTPLKRVCGDQYNATSACWSPQIRNINFSLHVALLQPMKMPSKTCRILVQWALFSLKRRSKIRQMWIAINLLKIITRDGVDRWIVPIKISNKIRYQPPLLVSRVWAVVCIVPSLFSLGLLTVLLIQTWRISL
jgi:hypothetical protein